MLNSSKLYEVNTRVWTKRFGEDTTLTNIPSSVFKELTNFGFDAVWLMGIWKTSEGIADKYCFTPELISSYNKALKNWERKDIIGSPYSVDAYEINPLLGCNTDLLKLKEKLNSIGLKLILDFVPNHFSAESRFIETNPEIFLKADEELLEKDHLTFYHPKNSSEIFVHGRDPFFLPWTDTVQVNYFSKEARDFMINQLIEIAGYCDGVRCDMAMLPLNNVFHNTWMGVLNRVGFIKPENEFWEEAIKKTKEKYSEFIFLGETYWDLEWQLQQLGFDFTYDKRLTDRLIEGDINNIKSHLLADNDYQKKSVRFLENHDEERTITKFGKEKSLAAAVVINTIMGMKLINDGQIEGKRIRLPVQLGREPVERTSERVKKFYHKIFQITKEDIFKKGKWMMIEPFSAGEGNSSFHNFLIWSWEFEGDYRIIVINYSEGTSQCRLKFHLSTNNINITLIDLLTSEEYSRLVKEMDNPGLFIELKGYNSHIFAIKNH